MQRIRRVPVHIRNVVNHINTKQILAQYKKTRILIIFKI